MSRTKTRTRKTTPKPAPAPAPAVDMRKHLPVRPVPTMQAAQPIHPDFLVEAQTAAYHAALLTDLPQRRIQDWTPTPGGGAHLTHPSGLTLQHHPGTDTPFTTLTPCTNGAVHTTPVATRTQYDQAVRAAAQCTHLHGRPRTLTLAQAATTTAETQALALEDIEASLTATDEQPKENPES